MNIDDSRFEFFLGKGVGPAFRQEYLITADSITGRSPYMPVDSALGTVKLGELEFERSTPPPDAAAEALMHRLSGSIGETFKLKASAMPKATNAAKAIANVQAKAIKSNDWFN